MKILNIEIIKVIKYVLHTNQLEKNLTEFMYEPVIEVYGKDFSTNKMIIEFIINYYSGDGNELLMEYESNYQFNYESESYERDISSLIGVLKEMYVHTEAFFQSYGFKKFQDIELGPGRQLEELARIGIKNLRANNQYKF